MPPLSARRSKRGSINGSFRRLSSPIPPEPTSTRPSDTQTQVRRRSNQSGLQAVGRKSRMVVLPSPRTTAPPDLSLSHLRVPRCWLPPTHQEERTQDFTLVLIVTEIRLLWTLTAREALTHFSTQLSRHAQVMSGPPPPDKHSDSETDSEEGEPDELPPLMSDFTKSGGVDPSMFSMISPPSSPSQSDLARIYLRSSMSAGSASKRRSNLMGIPRFRSSHDGMSELGVDVKGERTFNRLVAYKPARPGGAPLPCPSGA